MQLQFLSDGSSPFCVPDGCSIVTLLWVMRSHLAFVEGIEGVVSLLWHHCLHNLTLSEELLSNLHQEDLIFR